MTIAAPAAISGRSLLGKASALLSVRKRVRTGKTSRLTAAMAVAREHVVTFAALGAFDMGAFQIHIPHAGAAPGWAAVCVSLLAIDFAVRG